MDGALRTRIDALGDGLHRIALGDGRRAVVKHRRAAPRGFFAMEAHGLGLLAAAAALRVPAVLAVADDALALEDLGRGRPGHEAWARAGAGLARLHARHGARFGLDRDGWCGAGAQANTPMDDGWRFFAECRLLPQARRARDAGLLDARDAGAVERLCAALPARVPAQPPSLVHGDLWTANLHGCADGDLALIDAAAAHHGWAETDLAMLTLFGSPPQRFFDAYQAAAGIDARWRGRAGLYNLYHLLNHLNLFGAGYRDAVRATLAAWA
ncbi:fructosamine kinase family protein [Coralloluteibacterium stylophorae]|uniref:Fructosamine kinase family protein n=1 Tax=Coralloluteibacterium stylophorae TaxID=1776034 RepID=A0A8J7VQR3_9GAMM|nr:fructosamine kinase family protein [Coralloluteibacterium stylophorae]MBS7458100.1 fructosamine kinase family protein [Coralloluteibacterium stylophorae]